MDLGARTAYRLGLVEDKKKVAGPGPKLDRPADDLAGFSARARSRTSRAHERGGGRSNPRPPRSLHAALFLLSYLPR
jgi:hypothetical protein